MADPTADDHADHVLPGKDLEELDQEISQSKKNNNVVDDTDDEPVQPAIGIR